MSAVTLLCADHPLPLYNSHTRRVRTVCAKRDTVTVAEDGFAVQEHEYYCQAVDELGLPMKPCRYELNLRATEEDAAQLRDYLRQNCISGETVELWQLWVGAEQEKPARYSGCLDDLDRDTLEQLEAQPLGSQTCLSIQLGQMDKMLHVVPLDASVQGRELVFRYETSFYYDTELIEGPEGWTITFRRKAFPRPVEKIFTDTLMSGWLEAPKVFAAQLGGETVGYLELNYEAWNARMRVSNLWVEEGHRRQGVGNALMARAESEARAVGARALVLETQSCNDPAISFYRKQGFTLTGTDLTAYSQADLTRREVRLELARPVTP